MLYQNLADDKKSQLDQYLTLLNLWNERLNLTAVPVPQQIDKIINDSLALYNYLDGPRILDFGTGAGIPGIPLAVAIKKYQFTLLDSQLKRIHFLTTVKGHLGLNHVDLVHARSQDFKPDLLFDQIICRAVAETKDIIQWTKHLLAPGGQWLLLKGPKIIDELESLGLPARVEKLEYGDGLYERYVAIIEHTSVR